MEPMVQIPNIPDLPETVTTLVQDMIKVSYAHVRREDDGKSVERMLQVATELDRLLEECEYQDLVSASAFVMHLRDLFIALDQTLRVTVKQRYPYPWKN